MKDKTVMGIIVTMLVVGIGFLLYPTVGNYIFSLKYHKTITDYRAALEEIDDDTYEKLIADAVRYNEELADKSPYFRDLTDEELDEYYKLLDPFGTGIMGYVVIPSVNVSLPIYHGTEDAVLQDGIGHIAGTSFPVGGERTHAVISGHRGMVSSKLFTDIDKLAEGDQFALYILNEVLIYEVDNIKTILPGELGRERIETDRDECTLLTCTPYGVNTHRLLVTGHRVYMEEGEDEHEVVFSQTGTRTGGIPPYVVNIVMMAIGLFIMAVSMVKLIKKVRKRGQGK